MNKSGDNILCEMILLILIYGMLFQIGGLLFTRDKLFYSTGLWIGILIAIFMLIYMYRILKRELGGPSKEVVKYVRLHFFIRYFAVVLVYGLVIVIPLGNPLSCFAGIMGLKLAAYFQPLLHHFLKKKK